LIVDSETVLPYSGYFTYEDVPLKWHLPLGLLYDIYVLSTQDAQHDKNAPAPLPFKLTLHFAADTDKGALPDASPVVLHDSYINSVKEADFLRSGTAKPIMTLSAQDSKALWTSTLEGDLTTFTKIHNSLVPSHGQMRHIPLRLYLPSAPDEAQSTGQVKVLQLQISTTVNIQGQGASPAPMRGNTAMQPQTLGTALHQLIPGLFPSRRTPILATPLLHGVPLPMSANLEELVRWGCYADGWLSIVIAMRT
jgi:autophagy-related protein 5